jgi:integrase
MRKLINNRKKLELVTVEEHRKLFFEDWETVWENDRVSCVANKLASVTGMRASEVLGLMGCYVYDDHIFLCMQYDTYGYRPTKTKDQRNIPLPASMIADLKELKEKNGDGFIFSTNGGETPVTRYYIYYRLHRALENIGISKDEIKDRKIHLHSWRHFFNSQLLNGGLSIKQTQAVTGHKSERMSELYFHFDPNEYKKAMEIQEKLLSPVP